MCKINFDKGKANNFILNKETDKLEILTRIVDPVNELIFDFFKNDNQLSNNLCISGSWGSGKTSVINVLEENFKENKKCKKIKEIEFKIFNLWEYETSLEPYFDLVKDIIKTIYGEEELKKEIENENHIVSKWFKFYFKLKFPFIEAGSEVGVKKESQIKLLDFFKDSKNDITNELIKNLNEYAKNKTKKIVIIFDELDRCTVDIQITFLSYIKNIFFKVQNIFFIVSCDKNFIDKKLSLNNNLLESYTTKLFNKNIDLNLVTPVTRERNIKCSNNDLINKFIFRLKNDFNIDLSIREINYWLEKVDDIYQGLLILEKNKELLNNLIKQTKFIIFYCLYLKYKDLEYYQEIFQNKILNDTNNISFKESKLEILFNFIKEKINKNDLKLWNWEQTIINGGVLQYELDLNNYLFIGWDSKLNDLYDEYHYFTFSSFLPLILPSIKEENISDIFKFKKTKSHYIESNRSFNDSDLTFLNFLFNYKSKKINSSLKIFLEIIRSAEVPVFQINGVFPHEIKDFYRKVNYNYIFKIIEKSIYY